MCFQDYLQKIPTIDVNERVDKDYSSLVKPWQLPKLKNICFYNANLVDTLNGGILSNVNVLVSDGKILHIMRSNSMMIPESFQTIDCTGKYICPGLIDNHVHITTVQGETDIHALMTLPQNTAMMRVAANAKAILMRGFTTIRDCGGAEHYIRDAIDDGVFPGPRMILAGKALSQTGGHGDLRLGDLPSDASESCSCHLSNIGVICDGVPECLKLARENLRRGTDFIKLMGGGGVASPSDRITNLQFSEEEIQLIVKVAQSYGTYATAHCYTALAIKHCILNGVRGIEHGNLIDDEAARLMSELGCYLTPTLVTYKIMASDQFSQFTPPAVKAKNIQVLEKGLESVLIAKRNNVKICYGSDLLGALNGYQTQEFFIRSKILGADEILKSATVTPAECNSLSDKFGQIKAGFTADLLVLDKDPLLDITILDEPEKNLKLIMKGGLIYKNEINNLIDIKC